ncbi:MAG TPA: porin family protein [Phnomibacter sp.]|nr:porin family protein [Phnomibacter sp.]
MKQIFIFTFLFAALHANAQNKIGVQAGVLASRSIISGTSELESYAGSPKALTGYKFGVFAEIKLSDKVYFSPEINYLDKGSKYDHQTTLSNGNIVDVKRTIKTQYLELPVNLYYKAKTGKGAFFAGAGPVIGFGLKGKEESTIYKSSLPMMSTKQADIMFDGKEAQAGEGVHLKLMEIGLNIAVGYELKNGLRFNIQYRPNFNDIAPGDSMEYRNMYFGINLGFGL